MTLKAIEGDDYTGFELASTTSMYRKLVVNSLYAMTFVTGEFYCTGELDIQYGCWITTNYNKQLHNSILVFLSNKVVVAISKIIFSFDTFIICEFFYYFKRAFSDQIKVA